MKLVMSVITEILLVIACSKKYSQYFLVSMSVIIVSIIHLRNSRMILMSSSLLRSKRRRDKNDNGDENTSNKSPESDDAMNIDSLPFSITYSCICLHVQKKSMLAIYCIRSEYVCFCPHNDEDKNKRMSHISQNKIPILHCPNMHSLLWIMSQPSLYMHDISECMFVTQYNPMCKGFWYVFVSIVTETKIIG